MKRALLVGCFLVLTANLRGEEFVSVFDGASLEGWRIVPEARVGDWGVREGVIVGSSQGEGSYLVWKDEDLEDFELKLRYRFLSPGNSGVQVRALPASIRGHRMTGYHADFGDLAAHSKVIGSWDYWFAEGDRFIERGNNLVDRGQRVVVDKLGQKHFTPISGALTLDEIHAGDWNEVQIAALGNRLTYTINGKLASEVVDEEPARFVARGGIALQLHSGKPMTVEFKELQLRRRLSLKAYSGSEQ